MFLSWGLASFRVACWHQYHVLYTLWNLSYLKCIFTLIWILQLHTDLWGVILFSHWSIPVSVGLRRWVIQCAVYLSCLCRYLSQFRGIFFNACHQGRSPACLRNLFFFKFNLPEIPRVLLIYSLEKFSSFIYYYFPSICSLFPSEAPISHIWVANLVCFFFVISTISLSYFFFTWSPMLVISSQQRPCPFQFSFWVLTTVLESFFCNLRH